MSGGVTCICVDNPDMKYVISHWSIRCLYLLDKNYVVYYVKIIKNAMDTICKFFGLPDADSVITVLNLRLYVIDTYYLNLPNIIHSTVHITYVDF